MQAGADAGAEADGAFRVAGVGADHVAARKVQLAPDRERPAELVGGMAVGDVIRRAVVSAAGVVQRAADTRKAPGLLDAQVRDDVGEAEAVERGGLVGEGGIAGHGGIDAERGCVGIHGRGAIVTRGILERQRAGDAAAELGAIGPYVDAGRAGIAPDGHGVVAVGAVVGEEIEERLRAAQRESGELHERPIPKRSEGRACARVRRRGVLRAEAEVGAQGTEFGLLAHVPRQRGTNTVVDIVGDVAGEAGLRRLGRARADRGSAGAGIVFGLHTQISAQLDAGVGARNVVEAVAVKAADLHILTGLAVTGMSAACAATAAINPATVPRRRPYHLLTSFVVVVPFVSKLNLCYWRRNVRSRSQQAPDENSLVCCKNASAVHISRSAAKPRSLK